jgi:transcriptional regulator with XRE-family HTH domain
MPSYKRIRDTAALYEHIGRRIRELRLAHPEGALSQEALAAKLLVAPNTVSRWETGTYEPTAKDLESLARFFSVSITTFFPDLQSDEPRIAALTSATGGLNDEDFEEVIRYAEFRKARRSLEIARKGKNN